MAERSKAIVCKTIQPWVRIPLWSPINIMWFLWLSIGLLVGVLVGRRVTLLVVKEAIKEKVAEVYTDGWRDGQQALINKSYTEHGINQLEDWMNDDWN